MEAEAVAETGAEARTRALRRAGWQRWRCRVDRATTVWAVAYAGFGLVCALGGTPLFSMGDTPASPALSWAVVVVGMLAAAASGAVTRYGVRPGLRALLWVTCVLAGIAAFGLLMDVITLMFGQGVDSAPAAANHALAATGCLLLATTARAAGGPGAATVAVEAEPPAPSAATRPVQLAACAGTVAFLPYVAMKLVWVSGGTFAGNTGEQMLAISEHNGASGIWLTLESWGLDGTVLLAALGVFLLWGLVRPWGQVYPRWTPWLRGRRVPRRLPLVPALVGAATLAPYGVLGAGYLALATADVVTVRQGDFSSPGDALLVGWIGMVAFGVYGCALVAATRSYWARTRPVPVATERDRPAPASGCAVRTRTATPEV
ncbi:hypothetical protein N7925_15490 [Streptomyces sp. CA-278952]|uniref:hypothetical protein n=1 Tax=Streptomyces sp. CA-278952 TaxID=2980556 RepID=UPI00236880E8|nr:hypothetical protein [Streptomyces sp. CA-278952]WDG29649.1 hypothetical protein N7925_15490 [Streptomyces sp. CA-278952]